MKAVIFGLIILILGASFGAAVVDNVGGNIGAAHVDRLDKAGW